MATAPIAPPFVAACRFVAACSLAAAALVAPPSAAAGPQDDLIARINAYRSAPQTCEGRQLGPAGPLAPAATLGTVSATSGDALQQALRQAGYSAARVQSIAVTGPPDAARAFAFVAERHCAALLDPRYREIGVRRDGAAWRIVLAQPLLSDDLGDWRSAGRRVLELVNAARAEPRTCGTERFDAAPPVVWNDALAAAALAHSRDMADGDHFSHQGRDGSRVGERATRAGYRWRRIGENIATGQGSASQVVSGWLTSPGHCANIMNRHYTEMGAAYAVDRASDTTIFWTQVFGAPR